uniref:Uncharacterized protein n=1 Tax=viral metagenome TaxID=1070528 RepID=A0A6C0CJV6_9ZZZZ
MARSISLATDSRKKIVPSLITVILFACGCILLAYNNPGFVEQLFGGVSIGLSVLSGWLLAVDNGFIPGWFIVPGAARCEPDLA